MHSNGGPSNFASLNISNATSSNYVKLNRNLNSSPAAGDDWHDISGVNQAAVTVNRGKDGATKRTSFQCTLKVSKNEIRNQS